MYIVTQRQLTLLFFFSIRTIEIQFGFGFQTTHYVRSFVYLFDVINYDHYVATISKWWQRWDPTSRLLRLVRSPAFEGTFHLRRISDDDRNHDRLPSNGESRHHFPVELSSSGRAVKSSGDGQRSGQVRIGCPPRTDRTCPKKNGRRSRRLVKGSKVVCQKGEKQKRRGQLKRKMV